MEKSWILVGMMGAGKSAIGRSLATLSGRTHVDTDLLLQRRLGRPIPQLFRIYGEQAFRDHETSILRGLEPAKSVISTGGGIVLRPANWTELRRLGMTIFVKVEASELIARLATSKKKRPLLQVEEWQGKVVEIYEQRMHLYTQADLIVEISGMDIESAARLVKQRIEGFAQS